MFSLLALLAVLVLYGFLFIRLKGFQSDIKEIASERAQVLLEINQNERVVATNFAIRAQEVQELLDVRHIPTVLLGLMEEMSHPNVSLSRLAFSFTSYEAQVSGSTSSYKILAEQILIWEKNPDVTKVNVSEFDTDTTGRLKFSAKLGLAPTALAE